MGKSPVYLANAKSARRYILAQILGAYVAAILVYYQWKPFILDAEAVLRATGVYDLVQFTSSGPAGIFATYLPSGQSYKYGFLNEFINVRILLSTTPTSGEILTLNSHRLSH